MHVLLPGIVIIYRLGRHFRALCPGVRRGPVAGPAIAPLLPCGPRKVTPVDDPLTLWIFVGPIPRSPEGNQGRQIAEHRLAREFPLKR
jgi:hypothetical protein